MNSTLVLTGEPFFHAPAFRMVATRSPLRAMMCGSASAWSYVVDRACGHEARRASPHSARSARSETPFRFHQQRVDVLQARGERIESRILSSAGLFRTWVQKLCPQLSLLPPTVT